MAEDVLGNRSGKESGLEKSLLEFVDRLRESEEKNLSEEAVSELHLVTFLLGQEEYGVSIQQVVEIIRVSSITRVPGSPPNVRGVTNLRGRIVPIFEIGPQFGGEKVNLRDATRILLVEIEKRLVGLIVNEVRQVVKIPTSSVSPPPSDVVGKGSEYIVGVAKQEEKLVILLDLDKLLLGGGA